MEQNNNNGLSNLGDSVRGLKEVGPSQALAVRVGA